MELIFYDSSLRFYASKAAHCIAANVISGPADLVNVVGTVSATSDEGAWYETLLYVLHPEWNSAVVRHE